jgi:exodeoxyribonuclease VII large subunit
MSRVFDEVRARLRDAYDATSTAQHRLQIEANRTLRTAAERAEALNRSLAPAQLRARLAEARVRYVSAYSSSHAAIEKTLEAGAQRLGIAAASLDALSPLAVLHRGYAIAQRHDGRLLRDTEDVSVGDSINVRVAKGRLTAEVTDIRKLS